MASPKKKAAEKPPAKLKDLDPKKSPKGGLKTNKDEGGPSKGGPSKGGPSKGGAGKTGGIGPSKGGSPPGPSSPPPSSGSGG